MSAFIAEFWPALVPIIAFIVWLVRLEGRALAIEKEIARMGKQREEDLKNAADSREGTNRMLAEIRQDIKKLLERH